MLDGLLEVNRASEKSMISGGCFITGSGEGIISPLDSKHENIDWLVNIPMNGW